MFNNLNKKKLTMFGITFKANTNDVRESAAM
jgi:UDP-glucose 6-dehydrogenase